MMILWLQSPPDNKPVLPFDAAAYLERLELANKWLREHMSVSKVWPMMLEHFRRQGKYSEATARRDVQDAQRLLGPLDNHNTKYWCNRMLDCLREDYVAARLTKKFGEAARLAREIREYMAFQEELAAEHRKHLLEEVPRLIVFDPEVAGFERDPQARAKAEHWIETQKKQRQLASAQITDADVVDSPDASDPG